MNFTRMTSWHEISDDGVYVVCCASVMGKFRFTASKLAAEPGKAATILGCFDTAEEAREVCRSVRPNRAQENR